MTTLIIRTVILFMLSAVSAYAAEKTEGKINFGPEVKSFFDFVPENIVTNFSTDSKTPGGGLAYQWTTDNNVHIDLGVNMGMSDSSRNMGFGPHIGVSWKLE